MLNLHVLAGVPSQNVLTSCENNLLATRAKWSLLPTMNAKLPSHVLHNLLAELREGCSKPGTAPAPAQALIPNPNQAANAAESSGVDSSSSDEGISGTSDSSGSEEGSSSEDEAAPSNAGTKAAGPPAQGRAPAVVVSGGGGIG